MQLWVQMGEVDAELHRVWTSDGADLDVGPALADSCRMH